MLRLSFPCPEEIARCALFAIFSIGWVARDRVCKLRTLCLTRIPFAHGPIPSLGPRWSPPSRTVLPHAFLHAPPEDEPLFPSGYGWLWSCSNMHGALLMRIS